MPPYKFIDCSILVDDDYNPGLGETNHQPTPITNPLPLAKFPPSRPELQNILTNLEIQKIHLLKILHADLQHATNVIHEVKEDHELNHLRATKASWKTLQQQKILKYEDRNNQHDDNAVLGQQVQQTILSNTKFQCTVQRFREAVDGLITGLEVSKDRVVPSDDRADGIEDVIDLRCARQCENGPVRHDDGLNLPSSGEKGRSGDDMDVEFASNLEVDQRYTAAADDFDLDASDTSNSLSLSPEMTQHLDTTPPKQNKWNFGNDMNFHTDGERPTKRMKTSPPSPSLSPSSSISGIHTANSPTTAAISNIPATSSQPHQSGVPSSMILATAERVYAIRRGVMAAVEWKVYVRGEERLSGCL